ncbi:hypothetical protein HDU98_009348 [Podochytrium sp. JEL0797]|nr:hypothetical protein HDU98_009348 [Podochytrium sp. JEL0797]
MNDDQFGLHECGQCVAIQRQSYTFDDSGDTYVHCVVDRETRAAALAAASVASQLLGQQALLLATTDYALVYALHGFAASLEGQVCVLKGDPLALLDDANSYWWLVRCVKTDEVGYIPAENIETTSERVARLNKIRNVLLALAEDDDVEAPVKAENTRRIGFEEVPVVYEEYCLGEEYYDDEDEECDIDRDMDKQSIASADEDPAKPQNDLQQVPIQRDDQIVSAESSVYSPILSPRASATTLSPKDDDSLSLPPSKKRSNSFWSRLRKNMSTTPTSPTTTPPLLPSSPDASASSETTTTVIRGRRSMDFSTLLSRTTTRSPSRTRSPARSQSQIFTTSSPTAKPPGVALVHTPPVSSTPPSTAPSAATIRVLRIYSGNVDLNGTSGATFKTVAWTHETTVEELLRDALKRFKVPMGGSGGGAGVEGEYYLSVLFFESQERKLPTHAKIYDILNTLSQKKLPGLSNSKPVTKLLASTTNQILINDDQIIKLIVNRNVNMSEVGDVRLVRVWRVEGDGVRTYKTVGVAKELDVQGLVAAAVKKFSLGTAARGGEVGGDEEGGWRLVTVVGEGSAGSFFYFLHIASSLYTNFFLLQLHWIDTETVRSDHERVHDILALHPQTTIDFILVRNPITTVDPSSPSTPTLLHTTSAPNSASDVTRKAADLSIASPLRNGILTPPREDGGRGKRSSSIREKYDEMERGLEGLVME